MKNKNEQAVPQESVYKNKALAYFKQALEAQEYEDCGKLVRLAKHYGANQDDIDHVITSCVQGEKSQGREEGGGGNNRLRAYKEGA